MKTLIFRVGRGNGHRGDGAPDKNAFDSSPGRRRESFRRADLLALVGALLCASFFVISTSRSEKKEAPADASLEGAVAVIASVDTPGDMERENSVRGETSAPQVEEDEAPSQSTDAPEENSLWAYLETFLRRVLRRDQG